MLQSILGKSRSIRENTAREVLNIHTTHIVARKVNLEVLDRLCCNGKVAIHIRRTEHMLRSRCGLAPLLWFLVAATLYGNARRSLYPRHIGNLRLNVQAHNSCTRAIVTLIYHRAVNRIHISCIAKRKYIVQDCVEALNEEIGLHATEGLVEVARHSKCMRTLLLQVVSQADTGTVATHDKDMQILVKCLWSAETRTVCSTKVDVVCRVIAQSHTRRRDTQELLV